MPQSDTRTVTLDDGTEVAVVEDTDYSAVHLFTTAGAIRLDDGLPEHIDPPFGAWQFTAPLNYGAVLLNTALDKDFPHLREAFEATDYTVVTFPLDEAVGCMLQHLMRDGAYNSSTDTIEAFYLWDINSTGKPTAPSFGSDTLNAIHLDRITDDHTILNDDAVGRVHQWISERHPEYDWFRPETTEDGPHLAPLDTV